MSNKTLRADIFNKFLFLVEKVWYDIYLNTIL